MFKIIDFLYYLFFFTISMNVAKTDVKALSVHNVEISSDKKSCGKWMVGLPVRQQRTSLICTWKNGCACSRFSSDARGRVYFGRMTLLRRIANSAKALNDAKASSTGPSSGTTNPAIVGGTLLLNSSVSPVLPMA